MSDNLQDIVDADKTTCSSRVVEFDFNPAMPTVLDVWEACDEYFGASLTKPQVTKLIEYLTNKRDLMEDAP